MVSMDMSAYADPTGVYGGSAATRLSPGQSRGLFGDTRLPLSYRFRGVLFARGKKAKTNKQVVISEAGQSFLQHLPLGVFARLRSGQCIIPFVPDAALGPEVEAGPLPA